MEKLSGFTDDYEILIIDDAGKDRTGEIAIKLSREFIRVKVLHNRSNLGIGLSVLRGLKAAEGDIILYNGMDMPFDLDDLKKALPLLKENDIVVAARSDRSVYSLWRKITSIGNIFLLRLLFKTGLSDMSFIQVFKRHVLQDSHITGIISKSPPFVIPEMLIRARIRGYKITQIKVNYYRRRSGKSSYGKPRDIIWTLYEMFRFRYKLSKLTLKE